MITKTKTNLSERLNVVSLFRPNCFQSRVLSIFEHRYFNNDYMQMTSFADFTSSRSPAGLVVLWIRKFNQCELARPTILLNFKANFAIQLSA